LIYFALLYFALLYFILFYFTLQTYERHVTGRFPDTAWRLQRVPLNGSINKKVNSSNKVRQSFLCQFSAPRHEDVRRCEGTAPGFLSHGTKRGRGGGAVNSKSRPRYTHHPIEWRLGMPHIQSARLDTGNISCSSNPAYRLRYPGPPPPNQRILIEFKGRKYSLDHRISNKKFCKKLSFHYTLSDSTRTAFNMANNSSSIVVSVFVAKGNVFT
jgi:hypothetical protein